MYGRAVLWRRIPGWFRAWWLSAGRRPPREELRVATSQLVEALLSQWAQGDVGPWKRVVVTMDGQLVRPGDALAEAAYSFCEDAQNAVSLGIAGYPTLDALLDTLGPRLRSVWEAADRYWAQVQDMVPGEPPLFDDVNDIDSAEVRATVIAMHRRRPDGTYTTLAR